MIKLLHIPTGQILQNIFDDYKTLEWFFSIDKSVVDSMYKLYDEREKNEELRHNFQHIIDRLDEVNFINDPKTEFPYSNYEQTIYEFKARFCIEEFEVLV